MNCPFKTGAGSFRRESGLHHERNGICATRVWAGGWRPRLEVSGLKENTGSALSPVNRSSQNLSRGRSSSVRGATSWLFSRTGFFHLAAPPPPGGVGTGPRLPRSLAPAGCQGTWNRRRGGCGPRRRQEAAGTGGRSRGLAGCLWGEPPWLGCGRGWTGGRARASSTCPGPGVTR